MHSCPEPGCQYTAKTKGAITQHVNREHGEDPLAAVRVSMGASAPRPGAALSKRQLMVAPSGVPSVDFAIGVGGVPRGSIIEVYGPPASGKTFLALTFSAYAQQRGERAGFMDAEKAIQPTFFSLIPGLDVQALEYGMPPNGHEEEDASKRKAMLAEGWDGSGESALEASRRFIKSGQFAVWTVDSVHACTPRVCMEKNIGDAATRAALAQLFSEALRVIATDIERTNTLAVFVNHVKTKPGQQFGKDWSKPAGSAFDYYASVQLHVRRTYSYFDKASGRRIGHRVRVTVDKSKVAAPHASAEFDLYYGECTAKAHDEAKLPERDVVPGVDLPSSWFSVLKESERIFASGGRYIDLSTGENLGSRMDVIEQLSDPTSGLVKTAHELTYPPDYLPAVA